MIPVKIGSALKGLSEILGTLTILHFCMDSSCLMQSEKIVSIAWRWCFWEEPCTNQVNVNIFPRYWVPPQLCCTNEHRNQKRTTGIQSQPLGHCWSGGVWHTQTFSSSFSSSFPPDSFANVKAEWVGEVKQHKSSCPVCCGYQNRPENWWRNNCSSQSKGLNILSRTKKALNLPKGVARIGMWIHIHGVFSKIWKFWKQSSLR